MNFTLRLKLATSLLCASFIISSCAITNKKDASISLNNTAETKANNLDVSEDFNILCDDLYKFLLAKNYISLHFAGENPESLGISSYKISFEDISLEALNNNMQVFSEFYSKLEDIDSSSLNEDDKICFNTIKLFLETNLSAKNLVLYYEPLNPYTGIQVTTPILLLEYPFRNTNDIENYLCLLSSIDKYYSSILDFEKAKKEAGVFMSSKSVDLILSSLDKFLLSPNGNFMQESFDEKLNMLELDEELKADFKTRHNKILEENFANAYEILKNGLSELKDLDGENLGLWHYAQGKEYMEYLINSSIYPSFKDIDSMYNEIKQNLNKDTLEISKILKKGKISSDEIYNYTYKTEEAGDTLALLKSSIYGIYPDIGDMNFTIKNIPDGLYGISSPAFYISLGTQNIENIIYIDMDKLRGGNALTKLAHEGIPGHMYQKNYFLSKNPKKIWSLIGNPAYIEGMAVYAESLAYSFDKALSIDEAKVLEKNFLSRLALYAFLDLSINYYEKDKEYVATYLKDNYNIIDEVVLSNIYDSLVANPCSYLTYYMGYLEINNMKNEAKKTLGSTYSDLNFHKFLLELGPAPFSIIQQKFKANLLLAK